MSDAPESEDDATEDPSDRRLDEARKEGNVPLSREAVHTASLVVGGAALAAIGPGIVAALVVAVQGSLDVSGTRDGSGGGALVPLCGHAGMLGLVAVGAIAAAAVLTTFVQTQGGFWLNLLAPQPDRLFSLDRILHPFSKDGAVDLVIAALKGVGLLAIGAQALAPHAADMHALVVTPVGALLPSVAGILRAVLPRIVGVLAILAVVDVVLVRRRYTHKLRMKREDIKREAKEDEGDPQIKGKRRRRHRELAQGRVAVEVPRADAIVVNPTHIAIAIRYRKSTDKAPRVTAKGKGKHAEVMRTLATEHGIPIVRDVPLARFLHKKVKVGREVPSDVYKSVAAVLAYVYKVTGRVPGSGRD